MCDYLGSLCEYSGVLVSILLVGSMAIGGAVSRLIAGPPQKTIDPVEEDVWWSIK
jgi:hypothetical protein